MIEKSKLKLEYEKIQKYLKNYGNTVKEYNDFFNDMYGISIYQNKVHKKLKEISQEEEYEFFGKILVKLSETSLSKNSNKIGRLVDNLENFMPIKTEEDYEKFEQMINKYYIDNKTKEKEIIREFNDKTKKIFSIKEDILKLEDVKELFDRYNPEVAIEIIETLEMKLNDLFSDRNEELKKAYKSKADLLAKEYGIKKNKKGDIKKDKNSGIGRRQIGKCKTNIEKIGLKTY